MDTNEPRTPLQLKPATNEPTIANSSLYSDLLEYNKQTELGKESEVPPPYPSTRVTIVLPRWLTQRPVWSTHKRFLAPVILIILILIAVPIGVVFGRNNKVGATASQSAGPSATTSGKTSSSSSSDPLFTNLAANPSPTSTAGLSSSPPPGCETSHQGTFGVSIMNVTGSSTASSRRSIKLRSRQSSGTLMMTLANGILKDRSGRTGYIASDHQFQFDEAPQSGALRVDGFSICSNNSIAHGDSAIFWQCLDDTLNDLYDSAISGSCNAVNFQAVG